jgi:hypothetical protein
MHADSSSLLLCVQGPIHTHSGLGPPRLIQQGDSARRARCLSPIGSREYRPARAGPAARGRVQEDLAISRRQDQAPLVGLETIIASQPHSTLALSEEVPAPCPGYCCEHRARPNISHARNRVSISHPYEGFGPMLRNRGDAHGSQIAMSHSTRSPCSRTCVPSDDARQGKRKSRARMIQVYCGGPCRCSMLVRQCTSAPKERKGSRSRFDVLRERLLRIP